MSGIALNPTVIKIVTSAQIAETLVTNPPRMYDKHPIPLLSAPILVLLVVIVDLRVLSSIGRFGMLKSTTSDLGTACACYVR